MMLTDMKIGNHGSKALWPEQKESELYWEAVKEFLSQFTN